MLFLSLLILVTFAGSILSFDDGDVNDLRSRLDGEVFVKGEDGYEEAIHIRQKRFIEEHDPAIAVVAESTADVVHSVNFANEHDIDLSMVSGRHEFNSRNTGDGTMHINMMKMTAIERNDPVDVPVGNGETIRFHTINMQPGISFIDMHKYLAKHNLLGVSGYCESVSPGGYLTGGGYGPTSRMTGYGVDNVVQLTMVAMDGSVVVVEPNKIHILGDDGSHEDKDDPNLFWAMRGGLGNTFGIVTQYVYRVYEEPQSILRATGQLSAVGQDDHHAGYNALTEFGQWIIDNKNDPHIGGSLMKWNMKSRMPMPPGLQQIITFDFLYFNDADRGRKVMEPMIELEKDYQLIDTDVYEIDQLLDYALTHRGELVLENFNVHMVNRLLHEQDLVAPGGGPPPFVQLMMEMEDYHVPMCMVAILGGRAKMIPEESAAINPALRTAEALLKCEISGDPSVQHLKEDFSRRLHTIGTGVYPNEADYYIDTVVGLDWRIENWGSLDRYARLLSIKQDWDPEHMMSCHHCVGDDVSGESSNEDDEEEDEDDDEEEDEDEEEEE